LVKIGQKLGALRLVLIGDRNSHSP